jgi:hypothetical protein
MMLITRALSAAAMVAAITLASGAGSVTAQMPSNPGTAAFVPMETVYIGTPGAADNHRQTICGLDVVEGITRVACSNGVIVQYFHFAGMESVWGAIPLPIREGGSQKCPKHYKGHRDDNGHMWCMNSQGLSYSPENARDTEKFNKAHAIHSASFRE